MMLDVAPFFEDGAVSTKPVADGAVFDRLPRCERRFLGPGTTRAQVRAAGGGG